MDLAASHQQLMLTLAAQEKEAEELCAEEEIRLWTEVETERLIPLPPETAARATGQTHAFVIFIDRIDNVRVPEAFEDTQATVTVQLTLFDDDMKCTFGKTWESEPCTIDGDVKGTVDIIVNQSLWYKTKLKSDRCYGVFEVVFHAPTFDHSINDFAPEPFPDAVGAGWVPILMFPADTGDMGSVKKKGKIASALLQNEYSDAMYSGTPAILLTLEVPLTEADIDFYGEASAAHSSNAKKSKRGRKGNQDAAEAAPSRANPPLIHFQLVEATKPLLHVLKYVPENFIVSRNTHVPGLCDSDGLWFDGDSGDDDESDESEDDDDVVAADSEEGGGRHRRHRQLDGTNGPNKECRWISRMILEDREKMAANEFSITVTPSLAAFEDSLIAHMQEHFRGQHGTWLMGEEGNALSSIKVTERHLQIGVHNGLTYTTPPTRLPLTMHSPLQNTGGTTITPTLGGEDNDAPLQRHAAPASPTKKKGEELTAGDPLGQGQQSLRFKGTIDLGSVSKVDEFAVTLELVYTLSVPILLDGRAADEKQRKAYNKLLHNRRNSQALLPTTTAQTFTLRFGCVSPFRHSKPSTPYIRHLVPLLGAGIVTPENALLFTGYPLASASKQHHPCVHASFVLAYHDVATVLSGAKSTLDMSMGTRGGTGIMRPLSARPHRVKRRDLHAHHSQSLYFDGSGPQGPNVPNTPMQQHGKPRRAMSAMKPPKSVSFMGKRGGLNRSIGANRQQQQPLSMALEQKRISRQTQATKQPPLLATPRGKSPSSLLTNVSTGKKGQRPPQPRFNESILAGHQRSKLFTPQQSRAALQQSMMAQGSSLNPNPNPNLKLEGVPQLSLNDTTTKGNNVSSSAMYQQHQSLSGGERSILAAQAFLSADAQRQQQKLAQQQAQGIVLASDSSKFLTDKDMREVTPALRSSEISFPSQQQLHHAIAQQQQKRQQKLGQKRLDAFDDMGYPLGMQYKEMEFHGITRGLQARIANVPIHPLFTEKEMQELSILPNVLPFPPGPMRAADGQGSSLPAHFVKLQFVAMELFAPRKQPQLPGIPPWAPPQRFLFSFKFYKMPRTISRIVALSGEQRDSSQGQGAFVLPSSGVLCEIKYDGSVDGSGGYSVSLAVDHTHYGDDRAAILDYFANNPLVIDVVDADSLLPVGKAVVSLASLLRGDYRGVQNNATVDVVSPGQEGPGQHQRTGTFSDRRQEPFARPHPGAIVVGRLCMRLSSVGIPLVPSTHPTRSKQPNQHQAIISLGSASASAGGRVSTKRKKPSSHLFFVECIFDSTSSISSSCCCCCCSS